MGNTNKPTTKDTLTNQHKQYNLSLSDEGKILYDYANLELNSECSQFREKFRNYINKRNVIVTELRCLETMLGKKQKEVGKRIDKIEDVNKPNIENKYATITDNYEKLTGPMLSVKIYIDLAATNDILKDLIEEYKLEYKKNLTEGSCLGEFNLTAPSAPPAYGEA